MIACSIERIVDLASFGPVGEIGDGSPLLPLRDGLLVDSIALRERSQALSIF